MAATTLKDKVYSAVLKDVLNNRYTADSLLNERALAQEYGVSNAPVREALLCLCNSGVLRSIPRRGYRITAYNEDHVRDIQEFRTLLECGCLGRCFDRITSTQLLQLESVIQNETLFRPDGTLLDFWTRTSGFHLMLASFADNAYAYRQLSEALNTFMRAYMQVYWHRRDERGFPVPVPAEEGLHPQVFDAIRRRDREGALALLARDINSLSVEAGREG